MDLHRMLDKCHAGQWSIRDLDLSQPARQMPRADEEAIVQYFTDMAGIERLAGALFDAQRQKVEDPVLREILETFVVDEIRHSHAAQLLADHYDVHRYRIYQQNPHLTRFTRHFVDLVRRQPPDIATTYILVGELILDVALLRSLDDFVHDHASEQAMRLINRDESRHIAIDYHMVEYYSSDAYIRSLSTQSKLRALADIHVLFAVFATGAPFFQQVFFAPMRMTDPTGRRIREAFKRMQLLASKDEVRKRPFSRFVVRMYQLANHPILGRLLAGPIAAFFGIDVGVIATQHTESEARRARGMSFDELAEEALQAKYAPC